MSAAKRIFAIGDIHGCLHKLETIMGRIHVSAQDTLVFLGDYIDRGPDPKGVVDYLLNLKVECEGEVVCLRGNHEEMFLDYIAGINQEAYLCFGGRATVESYYANTGRFRVPESHLDFYRGLPSFYETPDYVFVHAGLRPGVPISQQVDEDRLWIRSLFINSSYDWGKRVIFGHTPFLVPHIEENKIGIDTGAVYGRDLTCLILPEVDFVFA